MKRHSLTRLSLISLLSIVVNPLNIARAQSTAFTYQGRLSDGVNPAGGSFDLRFALYDAATFGTQQGLAITNSATAVSNGFFTVVLDFGNQFPGAARWLEIGVRTNVNVAFTLLSPRQALTAAPYAYRAAAFNGAISNAQLSGIYGSPITLNNAANSFSGSGSGLTALNASSLTAGTVSDARLSANVALRSGGNAFTGNQTVTSGNIGIGTTVPAAALHVTTGTDATLTGGGYLVTGNTNAANLVFDNNEVMARNNGVPSPLFLNADGGNVGIGLLNPQGNLHIQGSSTNTSLILSPSGSDAQSEIFLAENASASIGFVLRNEGNTVNNNLSFIPVSSGGVEGATLMSLVRNTGRVGIGTNNPISELHVNGTATMNVCQIIGGSDLAEPMVSSSGQLAAGSLVVIDDEHPGKVKLSAQAYDSRVAGIISGANGVEPGITLRQEGVLDGGQLVALSGRVYALADATQNPIKPGDLLTTSDTAGHCMKVQNHDLARGAIIGKAMSTVSSGRGMVLVLVSLQ